ncbi:cytochrome b5 [Suhomyces tanzawaensis NRRL Y-17324]|uniref:Cytochrome b5 n=1 Tax=Suhomyces tanzawaensis NRRL Y-17324 TaxID=984487 RepID=A0A1E4SHY8_9ASCO|nr:cytochrome b5 [Suhomyces tanzawaensis NRRL Y-17324]ODV79057.1 cytochrome b5 [Suhomyces tanzawaensis NRRL Y-17324]
MSDLKVFTSDEVAKHNTVDDLWIVYNGKVYDITKYIDEHPGGEEVVVDVAGTDATEAFDDIGHSDEAHEVLSGLLIGKVEGGVIKETKSTSVTQEGGVSSSLLAIVVILLAFGAYFYFQNQ